MGNSWDWRNFHVQRNAKVSFPTAETILIAAGPPTAKDLVAQNISTSGASSISNLVEGVAKSTANVDPVGLVENFAINQNMGNSKIFEIGSSRSYIIPGKYSGSMNMSRILGFSKSILAMLWGPTSKKYSTSLFKQASGNKSALPGATEKAQLWMNIGSQIFLDQIGLLFWILTTSGIDVNDDGLTDVNLSEKALSEDYGAFYVEYAALTAHQFGANAGAVVLMENIGLMFERMTPVSVSTDVTS